MCTTLLPSRRRDEQGWGGGGLPVQLLLSARGATLLSVVLEAVQGKPRQGWCITLLPYYERITDLPPLFFPCRPDLKWRHNVFTTTATCFPNRMFGLTCFRIRYPINFHKHRYSIRIMFNMWRFHDVALTATMIKMYQFNEKMWQQEFINKKNKHNVKLAMLYDSARQRTLLLCCAKFKVTARRFCLLDANALGPPLRYKARVLPALVRGFYPRFIRVLPAVL